MFPPGGPYPHPEPPDRAPDPESDQARPLVDAEDIDRILHDPVLRWRAEKLAEAGMNPRQARALALDRSVDVHWVVGNLLRRGCPADIAFDIAS